jgi:hypothetical protein
VCFLLGVQLVFEFFCFCGLDLPLGNDSQPVAEGLMKRGCLVSPVATKEGIKFFIEKLFGDFIV